MLDSVSEKIYTVLTKRELAAKNDPDITFIRNTLKEIPENKIENFYLFLVGDKNHFNQNGFMSHFHITNAMKKFKKKLLEELWSKNGLHEKARELQYKIEALNNSFIDKSVQEVMEYCNKIDLGKFFIKVSEGNLLNEKEIDILKNRSLAKMIVSFRDNNKNQLFGDINTSLWDKVGILSKTLISLSGIRLTDYCEKIDMHKFKASAHKKLLFNKEEIEVISQRSLWNMVKALHNESLFGLYAEIEGEYKTYITKKYFETKLPTNTLPKLNSREKKVVHLLGGVKRF